ncbi:MAG: methionyl-tRNA formyltransferase [Bdellovibrionales bacterium]|nr:methionyl-tRNA formyltransferase [Bdellovibrionales bacterium]
MKPVFKRTSKVVFFGTPDFAVPILEAICASGRSVQMVITQPDRKGGRGNRILVPAVKQTAITLGIPVLQPEKIKSESFMNSLRDEMNSIFVVAAFGRILHQELIDIPYRILNVHASILPRWRGAAPIARAIMNGDKRTGVSVMKIVRELDAGPTMLKKDIDIDKNDTTGTLTHRLAILGAQSIIEALNLVDLEKDHFLEQDSSQATYASPIENEEAQIIWNKPAEFIHNQVRALQPSPGAYTTDCSKRLKIHQTRLTKLVADKPPGSLKVAETALFVATQDRWLEIIELQREGKARQLATSFLQGYNTTHKTWS